MADHDQLQETLRRKSADVEQPIENMSARPEPREEEEEERRDETTEDMAPVRRTRTTASTAGSERPDALRRTTTRLGTAVRKTTGRSARPEPQAPYPIDDMTDSDSSSDDSEAEAAPGDGSAPRRTQTNNTQASTATEKEQKKKEGRSFSRFAIRNEFVKTRGRVSKRDGRLNISISQTEHSGYVAKALAQSIRHHLNIPNKKPNHSRMRKGDVDVIAEDDDSDTKSIASSIAEPVRMPTLNIVVMVIGSRGDIQPFLKIGKVLKKHGHRVRIATHPVFRDFVEKDNGLEFFSIGGDPSELMSFMVKNPGLIPNLQTIREGEIQRRRTAMGVMFDGFWNAAVSNKELDEKGNPIRNQKKSAFVADAIIANPPSMAHVHVAEKLGIPLHIMFTFPYSPTQQFPHPLANVKQAKSNADANYINFMSYPLVEMMTWQGLGDVVNHFRERTLGLEPVSSLWAPGALYRMRVPYTYMWSPSLVPKPKDWGTEISLAGYVFLEMPDNYKPDKELEDFLNAGDPPIYIGFGSIVVDDPDAFTDLIFEATKKAGVRALVNKGWGGFGKSNSDTPDHIFMLGNTPHDWLFPRVKAVVHHGGAGTTAAGLKYAKPTMIVPFFGDQPFWGAKTAEAKAGAHECIPYKRLTVEDLQRGIEQCLTEEAQTNVQTIADSIEAEGDGAENAVKAFHRSLALSGNNSMRCSILTERVAVWRIKNSSLRLSALAAELLFERGEIKWKDLKLLRHYEWNDFDGPGEPITGGIGAVKGSLYDMGEGVGMMPVRIAEHLHKHEAKQRKKRERQERKEERKKAKGGSEGAPTLTRENTHETMGSTVSAEEEHHLPRQLAGDVGTGFRRSGAALITMPNNLHMAIARGFHNAPRLWGDATVRKPVRITGVRTGFEAARKEFAYSIWDGWTGVATQPYGGWQDGSNVPSKISGFGSGVGKGLGGFVLKNITAIIAPPAYIGKGFVMSVKRRTESGPGTRSALRKAQISRGHEVVTTLSDEESRGESTALTDVTKRVEAGWAIYQELWAHAQKKFGPIAGNAMARYKFNRERRKWEESGALDNVQTAGNALEAWKSGQDMEAIFAKNRRKKAKSKAALDQQLADGDVGEEGAVGAKSPDGTNELPKSPVQEEKNSVPKASEDSEASTKVETPNGVDKSAAHDMAKKMNADVTSAPQATTEVAA